MKFIHTADIHWGMNPDSDKPWSRDRAQAIKDTFSQIIRQARLREVDFLFLSGDLFHRQPLKRDLKEVNYLFATIPNVQVVIIAGNHDRIQPNSALLSFAWAPNVTWIMDQELTPVFFEGKNTEVWGFSYHTSEITNPLPDSVRAPETPHIHILLAHGGDASHLPLDRKQLSDAGFSYAALGHIHKPELSPDNRFAFPGSPEPLDKTETGPHGMIVGEIDDTTFQVSSLEFVPMAKAQYISLTLSVTPDTTNAELSDLAVKEIRRRGTEHIYRLLIRGTRDPDIRYDLEPLKRRMQILEIIDESEPQYDFARLFSEHPGDMIGFYIQALQKEEASQIEKKALYYGIDALLHTTDERSQG